MAHTELRGNTGLAESELFCLTLQGAKVEHDENGNTIDKAQCRNEFTLQQCAENCAAIGSMHFQYGKNSRDKNCGCSVPGDHHTLTDNANWDLYGLGNATLASLGPPLGVSRLAVDKSFAESDLVCMNEDESNCQSNYTLQECADFCIVYGSKHFQYGKKARGNNCGCAKPSDHHTLTEHSVDWDIYGIHGATLKEINTSDERHLNAGVILAITFGVAFLLIGCLLAVICFRRRWRNELAAASESRALAAVADEASGASESTEQAAISSSCGRANTREKTATSGENPPVAVAIGPQEPALSADTEAYNSSDQLNAKQDVVLQVVDTAVSSRHQNCSETEHLQAIISVSDEEINSDELAPDTTNPSLKFDLSMHERVLVDDQEIAMKLENTPHSQQDGKKLENTFIAFETFFPQINMCCVPRNFDRTEVEFAPPTATATMDEDIKVV